MADYSNVYYDFTLSVNCTRLEIQSGYIDDRCKGASTIVYIDSTGKWNYGWVPNGMHFTSSLFSNTVPNTKSIIKDIDKIIDLLKRYPDIQKESILHRKPLNTISEVDVCQILYYSVLIGKPTVTVKIKEL
jgi:hypothetical protein